MKIKYVGAMLQPDNHRKNKITSIGCMDPARLVMLRCPHTVKITSFREVYENVIHAIPCNTGCIGPKLILQQDNDSKHTVLNKDLQHH